MKRTAVSSMLRGRGDGDEDTACTARPHTGSLCNTNSNSIKRCRERTMRARFMSIRRPYIHLVLVLERHTSTPPLPLPLPLPPPPSSAHLPKQSLAIHDRHQILRVSCD